MPPVRRLAAILAADVAGYSRLMGADEEGHPNLSLRLRCLPIIRSGARINAPFIGPVPRRLSSHRRWLPYTADRPENSTTSVDANRQSAQRALATQFRSRQERTLKM
jgi:hypothetical protein